MEFSQAVSTVFNSDAFIPEDGYLVHGFFSEGHWQVGFYNPDNDRVTAYVASDDVVRQTPEEAFKKDGAIPKLLLEDVSLSRADAEEIALEHISEKHPEHPVNKRIVLVQMIEGVAAFNITLVTATLHMYNIKIAAASGKVLSEVFESILALRKE